MRSWAGVTAGALVIILMGALTVAALLACYTGSLPLIPTLVALWVCGLPGGWLAARWGRSKSARLGILSGLSAGLAALLGAVLLPGLAIHIVLAAVAMMVLWSGAGAVGALLA